MTFRSSSCASGHLEVDIDWQRLPPQGFDARDVDYLEDATSLRIHALTHRPVSWLMPAFLQASSVLRNSMLQGHKT